MELFGQTICRTELSQKQIICPHILQGLLFLETPITQLENVLRKEVDTNPVLEPDIYYEEDLYPYEKESFTKNNDLSVFSEDSFNFMDSFSLPESLISHLLRQSSLEFSSIHDLAIAETIIGSLDADGLLRTPIEEIAILSNSSLEDSKKVWEIVKSFDPLGIASSSFQESLLKQNQKLSQEARSILKDHFSLFINGKAETLAKKMQLSLDEIKKIVRDEIAKLPLRPGSKFKEKSLTPPTIIPDISILKKNDNWEVSISRRRLPILRKNNYYTQLSNNPDIPEDTKSYIAEKILAANRLIKNLASRESTLLRIGKYLLEKQKSFFESEIREPLPGDMKNISQELDIHYSTLFRAISHKHLLCPQGLLPLKTFFSPAHKKSSSDISLSQVKNVIQNLIAKEKHPLTDAQIEHLLSLQGISCARRTINKYRHSLGLQNKKTPHQAYL